MTGEILNNITRFVLVFGMRIFAIVMIILLISCRQDSNTTSYCSNIIARVRLLEQFKATSLHAFGRLHKDSSYIKFRFKGISKSTVKVDTIYSSKQHHKFINIDGSANDSLLQRLNNFNIVTISHWKLEKHQEVTHIITREGASIFITSCNESLPIAPFL